MKKRPPPLMSHADRRRLIEAPIIFNTYGRVCWGGTQIYRGPQVSNADKQQITSDPETTIRSMYDEPL